MTTPLVIEHQYYIQKVYDQLPNSKKLIMRRYGPYDRIKIKPIGVPSGLATVYDIDGYGKWVAKVNKLHKENEKIFAENNKLANDILRTIAKDINSDRTSANIAVYDTKHYLNLANGEAIAITFERKMIGETLLEFLLHSRDKSIYVVLPILNKIKRTLEALYAACGFIHHDLHCGNIYISKDMHPTIFDFDWVAFARPFYSKNLKKMLNAVILPNKHFNHATAHKPMQNLYPISNCSRTQSWYHINAVYSLYLNYHVYKIMHYENEPISHDRFKVFLDDVNANKDNILKCDMTMLVNDILLKLCQNTMNSTKNHIADFDKKVLLFSGVYF